MHLASAYSENTYLLFGLGISKGKLTEHLRVIFLQPLYSLILSTIARPNKDEDLILSKINALNITKVKVCADTGDIDNDMCPVKAETLFIKGKSPIKQSGIYRKMLIDLKTGMPACNFIKGQTEYKTVNLWPTDMLSVYQKAGIHIHILPKPIPTNHRNRLIN